MSRHILSMSDFRPGEIEHVLDLASEPPREPALTGKGAALIFEHPSARTRNAMEMAVVAHKGHPVTIRGEEIGLDVRESAEDVARTLACFHHLIGARVAKHATLERMALALDHAGAQVPVINLLSDYEHPSQAFADLLTIRENFGELKGVEIAYIGDANNVARSLAIGAALTGAHMRIASPEAYALGAEDRAALVGLGADIEYLSDPEAAARGADVLYADVWVSMGEEAAGEAKRQSLAGFSIDDRLVALASKRAIVMHCLPAHRGEEIAASVIDGPRSRVWQQAKNRMHSLIGLIGFAFEDGH
jgi:ornithine carbamoyltransferase